MNIFKIEVAQIKMKNWKLFHITALFILIHCFHYVQCTEVTVTSHTFDASLGYKVEIPVLMCHARHTGYKSVTWYKDYTAVKNGTSNLSSHVLPLASLVNSPALPGVDNPLKLQGYYWCETDHTEASQIHDYLFRMDDIHTFVGRFVAKNDDLGEDNNLNFQKKIEWKMQLYEAQMEQILFKFLQPPSVYVTDIKVLEEGLQVKFFLFDRPAVSPRKSLNSELVTDEHHLLYIKEYLRNETSQTDPILYYSIRNWTDLLGIEIQDRDLKSTLGCYGDSDEYPMMHSTDTALVGCYKENYPVTSKGTVHVVWPYAWIGDVVIPENACSTKEDLAVTRNCTGSFYLGATWGRPSGECQKPAGARTHSLKNLACEQMYGRYNKSHIIHSLAAALGVKDPLKNTYYKGNTLNHFLRRLGITDLHITIDILKDLSLKPKLSEQDINEMLSVIDSILEANKTVLIAAKNTIHLTSRILEFFDNLLKQATDEEKEIQISRKHLMVDTKYTKTDDEKNPILGLAVIVPSIQGDTLENGSIEFMVSNKKLPHQESLAYFVLPQALVRKRESKLLESSIPCQVNMIFFKEWDFFPNPKGVLVKRNYKVLQTPVMYVSISGGPAWNLSDPVHLYIKDTLDVKVEDPVCVFYDRLLDDGNGAWSTEGCEYEGYKNGYYHCQCHHLSIFAVILSESPMLDQGVKQLKLGTSVYVACGASILSLSLAVILFVLSKHWRQTVDQSILFSLSLCFLVCIIIIFISETSFARKPGCIVLALVLYYTVFTIFGWLLVQAILYRFRFAKKTDVSEVPHFMIKTGLLIWGVPIIIVVIMWFSREYPNSSKENCWPTVSEVSKEALIPLVVLMVITLCIYACAMYSLTGRFRKDFLTGDLEYNDVVVKFRVAFTIFLFFVLTWLFGHFAIHCRTQTLRILFSICITLTAYYVALFFIFQEVSFWDLCRKCKKNQVEPEDAPTIQYQAKSYESVRDSNEIKK